MAISIDPATRIISVPQADMTSLGGGVYEYNLNAFRLELKDWEDSPLGIDMPDTHTHDTESLLAGVLYARKIQVINGYTVTFEDGQYAVSLVGANSNVQDVANVNQVSVRPNNSAGLVVVSPAESVLPTEIEPGVTVEGLLRLALAMLAGEGEIPTDTDGNFFFKDWAGTKNRLAGLISGKTRTFTTKDPT
jgi:hypothetical protein